MRNHLLTGAAVQKAKHPVKTICKAPGVNGGERAASVHVVSGQSSFIVVRLFKPTLGVGHALAL
jgi:hypothetical protein